MDIKIDISTDFTDAPGARFREDGDKSGQEFYEDLLKPKFDKAVEEKVKLIVNLDNTWGYASSFISGSFGKLSQEYGSDVVLSTLEMISNDEPLLIDKIKDEILKPNTK